MPAITPQLTAAQRATLARLRWRNVDYKWKVGDQVTHWEGKSIGEITSVDLTFPDAAGKSWLNWAVVRWPDGTWVRLKRHEMVRVALLPADILEALKVVGEVCR